MARIEDQRPWIDYLGNIIAQPDDDQMRLFFATEWEKQQLDPNRAALIRLQVKLAALTGGVDNPEWFSLASQARLILHSKSGQWVPEGYGRIGVQNPHFYRGFIELVTVPAKALLNPNDREELMGSAPIRHLNIVELAGDEELKMIINRFDWLEASRILSLNVDGQNLTDKSALLLATSKLQRLRWLSLAYNEIGQPGVRALAESGPQSLEFVNLQGNPCDPVERIYEDQGVVVDRAMPEAASGLPQAKWMRRAVKAGHLIEIDRFQTSRSLRAHNA
jgi:uncharacterized protein (TIGR02996 family)